MIVILPHFGPSGPLRSQTTILAVFPMTFKMKTNAVYLKLHTHTPIDRKNIVVSDDLGDSCCCVPLLDDSSFENGYFTTEDLVC
jgi:hypothetical protein